jgi:NDP-sugar pyrophosphorylase family protein
MLTNESYDYKILGHLLDRHEHAFCISKAKDYYLAHMHFIAGHLHPYTLSSRVKSSKPDELKFVTKNFNKIIFSGVTIPRTTYLSNNCYIGEKSKIGHNTTIEKSIVAEGCQISNNVTLKNCLILEGCTIAQQSTFENCLIEKVK